MNGVKTRKFPVRYDGAQDKILITLCNSDKPLKISELTNATKLDRQLVNYHLPKMIAEGLILDLGDQGYIPQQILADEDFETALYKFLTDNISAISDRIDLRQADLMNQDEAECIIRIIQKSLNRFVIDLSEFR